MRTLAADLAELKGAQERVAALEGELATKTQALSGSDANGLPNVAKELGQEKESQGATEVLNSPQG